MLDAAFKSNPDAVWWIKGDACDVVSGLCESVDSKWSGDVDLNDGEQMREYQVYKTKLEMVATLGLGTRRCKGSLQ